MIRVDYNGLVAHVRDEDLAQAIESLSEETPSMRKQMIMVIEAALDEMVEKFQEIEEFSQEILQNTANDICIWFANEIIEGRAERNKASLQ